MKFLKGILFLSQRSIRVLKGQTYSGIKHYLGFFNFPNEEKQNSKDSRNQNEDYRKKQEGDGKNRNSNKSILLIMLFMIGVFAFSFFFNSFGEYSKNMIPYSQFLIFLDKGEISSVTIVDGKEVEGILSSTGGKFRTLIPYPDGKLMEQLQKRNVMVIGKRQPITIIQIISSALPWLVSILFIFYMLRGLKSFGGGSFPFAKSKVRSYVRNDEKKVTFADVAGQDEAKYELKEVVEFLKIPDKFQRLGARIPRGVLLVGAPGTGKTLLARACAGEAHVSFFYMSGSDFVEMFAGVGAGRVRELFDQARKSTPCIIFIDELDAVGRSRSSGYGGGVHDEREQTLNQLLVEMDGFDIHDRIIVLAATNRADVLDTALLRPGRFDRQVVVDMPDLNEREQILKIHVKNVKLGPSVNLTQIARATVGCSGADLANLVNEAALFAARVSKNEVLMEDFEEARDKILMGAARKSKVITPEDKLRTARHESGHALLHLLLKNADPLHKVTIIPRGRALGVAFSLPEKDSYGKGKGYLMDRISICYGGFIAENIYYSENSTGVQNDLEQATELASKMVRDWGMSKLGAISYSRKNTSLFFPIDSSSSSTYSDETSREIDKEIKVVLGEAFDMAKDILEINKDKLDILANELMKCETLLGEQVSELLNLPMKGAGLSFSKSNTVSEDVNNK